MICDIKPDLKYIADRERVPDYGRAEHGFAKGWNTNEDVSVLAGTRRGETQCLQRGQIESLQIEMGGDPANEPESESVRGSEEPQADSGALHRPVCPAAPRPGRFALLQIGPNGIRKLSFRVPGDYPAHRQFADWLEIRGSPALEECLDVMEPEDRGVLIKEPPCLEQADAAEGAHEGDACRLCEI
jgi:hypothetical protein